MNTKRFIRIILLGVFLIVILSYANAKRHCRAKEQMLGSFRLSGTIEEVREKLGELSEVGNDWMYFKDCWSFWVDENDKSLKGISYRDMDIKDEYSYPKTSRGITIGNKLDEVKQAYGIPEQVLSVRAGFVLKNSKLSMIYMYPSKGLWISFINQKPYNVADDWRVVDIVVGDGDVIEHMFIGAPAYSRKTITQHRRTQIIKAYRKKYGNPKDLEIYDDYMLNLQVNSFEHIKSAGEYKVTPLVVLPKAYGLLSEIFDEGGPDVENEARKKVALKYNISLEELEEIIKRVGEFQWDRAYRKIVEIEEDS